MTVLPIDVIARSEAFEAAAAGRELRPWEWTFIHAVDGRLQLRDVAELCGLELEVATEIVSEQTEAGILRVVTMTLDGYRRWSGIEGQDPAEASAPPVPDSAAEGELPLPGRALHDALLAGLLAESEPAGEAFAAPQIVPLAERLALAMEPSLTAETAEPEPPAHDLLASDPFARELFTPEPLIHEPLAAEAAVADPFAHEPFAHESLAFEAASDVPPVLPESGTAGKGVTFSFDAFDGFERLDAEPPNAPAAAEGISLSFEPGAPEPDVSAPPLPAAGGVSLSFEPDSSPPQAFDARDADAPVAVPAAPALPEPPPGGPQQTAVSDSAAPLNLAFSADGFPILMAVPGPSPVAAPGAPPVPGAAGSEPAPPRVPAAEDQADIVGSLIARVLSIRIK